MKQSHILIVPTLAIMIFYPIAALANERRVWEGLHQTGFETHYFKSCNADGDNWGFQAKYRALEILQKFYSKYDSNTDDETSSAPEPPEAYATTPFIFLKVRGRLIESDGSALYGYSNKLIATEVLEIRQATQEDIDRCL